MPALDQQLDRTRRLIMKNEEIRGLDDLIKFTKALSKNTLEAIRFERLRSEHMIESVCKVAGLDHEAVLKNADLFMEKNWPTLNQALVDFDDAEAKVNGIFKDK